jgi:predicted TIM-barrel fold metal-dependent hydrolase
VSGRIIDCEVQAAAPSLGALLPYMSEAWAERFRRSGFVLPSGGAHPGGGTLPLGQAAPQPEQASAALPGTVINAVLVPHQILPSSGWCDTKLSAVYASALNAYLVEHWLPKDERFRLMLAAVAPEPDAAAEEIARYALDQRVVGVVLSPIGVNMGQRHYRPILQAAAQAGLAVMVHPSGQEGNIPGMPTLGGIGPRHPGEYACLIGQVAAANMASLIYDGTFSEFPNLQIIFAGFGLDWLLPTIWHSDMEWRNLRIDIPWVAQPPSSLLGRNVRVIISDTDSMPLDAFRHVVSLLPQGTLLYGSNSPFPTGQSALPILDDKTREEVMHANASGTFGTRVNFLTSA